MSTTKSAPAVPAPFADREPEVRSLYAAFVRAARKAAPGPVIEDPKKTCVHLNAGKDGSAFAGVHPRKAGLLITVKSDGPIESPRVRKVIRASAKRCYCDLEIQRKDELDAELRSWLASSYAMSLGNGRAAARSARP